MPSGTGMYEDSDDENFSHELSPTDGYFNQRPSHPQDLHVPDPSQTTSETDKAREAQQEREGADREGSTEHGTFASRRQSHNTSHSTSSRRRLDPEFEEETQTEHSPLIPAAPPTYSAATANRPYTPPRSDSLVGEYGRSNRQYDTMGRQEIFLPEGDPTSIGEASLPARAGGDGRTWKKKAHGCLPNTFRSCCKVMIVLIALMIGMAFVVNAIATIHGHRGSTTPIVNPVTPKPGSDKPTGQGPPQCRRAIHTASASFEFEDPADFTFIELVRVIRGGYGEELLPVQISGEIHVRPAPSSQEKSVRVGVYLQYSDHDMSRAVSFDQQQTSLQILSASHVSGAYEASSERPCMCTVATIYVKSGIHLDFLYIESETMKVIFHDDLSLDTQSTSIHIAAGSVSFPTTTSATKDYTSRDIIISTFSGSISGTFPLYDLLEIESQSGSITIDVAPKEALKSAIKPAKLKLTSNSGTVQANTPMLTAKSSRSSLSSSIPDRDYQSSLSSNSGSVRVVLLHSSTTKISTGSGSIQATLSPYGPLANTSSLSTQTQSGSTNVHVLASLTDRANPMRNFNGDYQYASGSLQIKYPVQWEGELEGTTLSGSIDVKWPGMAITRAGNNRHYGRTTVRGVKGHGNGHLNFRGGSGSVTLRGGDGTGDVWTGGKGRKSEEGGRGAVVPPQKPQSPGRWPGHDDEW
ncbi:hypothetical protein MMC19_006739 [Ptychographa xylographoides]|nr:hypothetical protein [Ptychographa xylographoides]